MVYKKIYELIDDIINAADEGYKDIIQDDASDLLELIEEIAKKNKTIDIDTVKEGINDIINAADEREWDYVIDMAIEIKEILEGREKECS